MEKEQPNGRSLTELNAEATRIVRRLAVYRALASSLKAKETKARHALYQVQDEIEGRNPCRDDGWHTARRTQE